MRPLVIDGADMTDRSTAHRIIKDTLGFPDWYGNNLDALADCLSELPRDVCVILLSPDLLKKNLGTYADDMIGIFEEISGRPYGCSFVICEDK